jgi:flagellar basal-body rod modification protein FlgD
MIPAMRANTVPGPFVPTEPAPVTGPVEPSAPRSGTPLQRANMGRDEFLKLLIAQLKNQDPMNPMDGKDMAAQLAQFSQVEQLIQLNESIEAQAAVQREMLGTLDEIKAAQDEHAAELAALIEGQTAIATVGKTAVTEGNTLFVGRGGDATIVVDTGARKGAGRLTLFNEKGEQVAQTGINVSQAGQQAFALSDFGIDPPLPRGRYTYRFEVATESGLFQGVKTYTTGRITGMRYEQGTPILIIGDSMSLPMARLLQLRS